jgi:YVTN family beta-propeller protein
VDAASPTPSEPSIASSPSGAVGVDVIATIPVGEVPLEATAGFGSIWVSNSESDTVSRIDPGADEVTATIDVCDSPEGFAIGGGSVWVVCENSGRVGIVDPASDRMVATVRVGNEPRFATFAFGSVWVSNYAGSSVSRIDPAKAKVIATITTDFGGQILAEFDGSIWVSSTDFNTVQRIDPSSNEVLVTIDTEIHPDGLLGVDGAMWVATDLGPLLMRIDPASNEVTESVEVAQQGTINANQLFVVADGDLWFPLLESAEVVRLALRPKGCSRRHRAPRRSRPMPGGVRGALSADRDGVIELLVSLSDLSTRRRREHCKNPNAPGQAVWFDARQWGSVEMTARTSSRAALSFFGIAGRHALVPEHTRRPGERRHRHRKAPSIRAGPSRSERCAGSSTS